MIFKAKHKRVKYTPELGYIDKKSNDKYIDKIAKKEFKKMNKVMNHLPYLSIGAVPKEFETVKMKGKTYKVYKNTELIPICVNQDILKAKRKFINIYTGKKGKETPLWYKVWYKIKIFIKSFKKYDYREDDDYGD